MPASVHLAPCQDYNLHAVRAAVRQCVAALGDLEDLLRPGAHLLVKPNLLRPYPPEQAVTTHPAVVQAVLELIAEAGATAIVADLPTYALADASHELFEITGLKNACVSTGAQYALISEGGYQPIRVERPLRLREFWGAKWVTQLDGVISLPKLKNHHEARMTCALKNMFGACAPRHRMRVHRFGGGRQFSEALADVCVALRASVTIADAIIGMEGDGPTVGEPRRIGLLAASRDPVALDTVAADLIGLEPERVRLISAAAEKGAGEAQLDKIELTGADPADFRLEFKPSPSFFRWLPPALGQFAPQVVRTEPVVLSDHCDGCGACVEPCPTGAMSLANGVACIDDDLCIHCFACQRACPRHALKTERTWFSRHLP